MTEATCIREIITIAFFVCRLIRTFQVTRHFLPTFSINRNNRLRQLFSGDFPEANAGDALGIYIAEQQLFYTKTNQSTNHNFLISPATFSLKVEIEE